MIRSRRLVAALTAALFSPALASAAWLPDGNPIAVTPDYEFSPNLVTDGQGGVLVSWVHYGTAGGVRVIGLDANGNVQPGWPSDGLILPELAGEEDPFMVSDGSGGAFLTATAPTSVGFTHLSPQTSETVRRDAAAMGAGRSAPPAKDAATMHEGLILSVAAPDGLGGAFVAFIDNERFYDTHLVRHYAADRSFTEVPLGALTGCGTYYCPFGPLTLCSDGAGGAFVAWSQDCGVRILRLTPQLTIAPGWPTTGVPAQVCPMSSAYVGMCPDGAGGAYVVWQGYPTGSHPIRIARFTGSGTLAAGWSESGLLLSPHPTMPGAQRPYHGAFCSVVPDGSGGALVAWTDERSDAGDIYLQRVLAGGALAPGWAVSGVAVGLAPGRQQNPMLTSDGTGGALVVWQDEQHDPNFAIRAARVDAVGRVAPATNTGGAIVSQGLGLRIFPRIASDDAQGAFIAWVDYRDGNGDIYATRVLAPTISVEPPSKTLRLDGIWPNPSRGSITCRVTSNRGEGIDLELIDLAGRVWVRRHLGSGIGSHELTIAAPAAAGSGLFFVRVKRPGEVRVSRISIVK